MDHRMTNLLQIFSMTIFAWVAYSWLSQLHWMLGAALGVFALANTATTWMLRERWPGMHSVLCLPVLGRYVRFVARLTGEPLSVDAATGATARLLLQSKRDFEVASHRAKQIVRGHDEVIDRMLMRVHENLTLRKRQSKGPRKRPLASFLLAGPDGVGKRYLACVLAKLLYSDGAIDVFACDQMTAAQWTGTPGHASEFEPLRKQPHRIVCFEHLDRAAPELVRLFSEFLTGGKLRLPGCEQRISLDQTIFIFTTTLGVEELADLVGRSTGEAAWQQKAIDALESAAQIDRQLLSGVTELLYTVGPDDVVKSEVMALLLVQECGAHCTNLTHVDPEIIATQVLQLNDTQGFATAPPAIKKLLRKPLVAATEGDHPCLSLRIRNQTQFPLMT